MTRTRRPSPPPPATVRIGLALLGLGLPLALGCTRTESTSPSSASRAAPKSSLPSLTPAPAPLPAAATTTDAADNAFVRPTGPVATVNGRDIAAEKFNSEFDRLVGTGGRIPSERLRKIARNLLNRLVDQELRAQAVRAEGLTLTDEEFDEAWREHTARWTSSEGRFDDVRFQADLARTHTTAEELRGHVRDLRLARKLVERQGKVEVKESDLRAFYDRNPSAWQQPASRMVRPVLVRVAPRATPEQVAEAEAKAREVVRALRKGEDFEQVASRHGSGALPPIQLVRGSSESELETVAFALKLGAVSEPVRTRWGFYVLRLLEKNDERVRPYAEVRAEIRRTLTVRRQYLEDRRLVQGLRQTAHIVEHAKF
jgi:parvulin-like peptidyl-prolyl isomerase